MVAPSILSPGMIPVSEGWRYMMGIAQIRSGQTPVCLILHQNPSFEAKENCHADPEWQRSAKNPLDDQAYCKAHVPQYTIATEYPVSVRVGCYQEGCVDTKFGKKGLSKGWTQGSDTHLEFIIRCLISSFKKLTYEWHTFDNTTKQLSTRLYKVHPPPPKRSHSLIRKVFLDLLNWKTWWLNYPLPSC